MNDAPGGVLSIGTTETNNIVGVGLDLRLLAERGLRGLSIVVAVSAQGPGHARDLVAVPERSIDAQFASIDPSEIGAIRIGALPTVDAINCVARNLERFGRVPVVLDPVLVSSRSAALTLESTVTALVRRLLPRVTVVVPNLPEATALSQLPVDDEAGMVRAGRALLATGARTVLVTGGHLAGDPVDVFVSEAGLRRFAESRIARDVRGTGCMLAVSLAAELALAGRSSGEPDAAAIAEAIVRARATVRTKIAHARRVGDQWSA